MAPKKNDNRTNILFRYGVVVLGILILSACIIVKLTETTIVDADKWNERIAAEMSQRHDIIPQRGNILAADGSILATNLNFYVARMDYRAEKFNAKRLRDSIGSLSEQLATYFPVKTAAQWREHLLKPLSIEPSKRPRAYKLLSGLSHADMQLMKSLSYFKGNRNRTGLTFERYMRRFNPYGNMAKRSIGRVGQTKESEEIHGRSGIEMALDSLLYGKTGTTHKVHLTKDIADMAAVPAVPGCDVVTTIDINMQDILENELNNVLDSCDADWGLAVLMDVKTGDIKAISNLEQNPDGPGYVEALNRAVMRFEPGSVIKTLSMMIAVEDGIVKDFDEMLPTGSGWAHLVNQGRRRHRAVVKHRHGPHHDSQIRLDTRRFLCQGQETRFPRAPQHRHRGRGDPAHRQRAHTPRRPHSHVAPVLRICHRDTPHLHAGTL